MCWLDIMILSINGALVWRVIRFACFDATFVRKVWPSNGLLAFVDKGAVCVSIPSPFVAVVRVLTIDCVPISRAFELTCSLMRGSGAIVRSVFSSQVLTGDEFLAISRRADTPVSAANVAMCGGTADEHPPGVAGQ